MRTRQPPLLEPAGDSASGIDASLTLWQLRAFLAVVECRSITEAARRLHITQSGLSRVIHELESILGIQAFDRRPAGLRLTAAGAAFEPYARRLAACYADAMSGVRAAEEPPRITLAASNVVLPVLLPTLLARPPGACMAAITLREHGSHEVLAAVANGSAALGLCLQPTAFNHAELECTTLLRAPLGLLASHQAALPNHFDDLAALSRLPIARLSDEMVLPQALMTHAPRFEAYFASPVVSNSMPALFSAVAQGQIFTFVSAIAAMHPACRDMRFIALPHLLPSLDLCVVSRADSADGTVHARWRDAVRASIAQVDWPDEIQRL